MNTHIYSPRLRPLVANGCGRQPKRQREGTNPTQTKPARRAAGVARTISRETAPENCTTRLVRQRYCTPLPVQLKGGLYRYANFGFLEMFRPFQP